VGLSSKLFKPVSSFQLNLTFEMGFCQHRAAKIIAAFDDAWAEKLEKSNFHNTDFLQFLKKRRQSIKKVIYQKKL